MPLTEEEKIKWTQMIIEDKGRCVRQKRAFPNFKIGCSWEKDEWKLCHFAEVCRLDNSERVIMQRAKNYLRSLKIKKLRKLVNEKRPEIH